MFGFRDGHVPRPDLVVKITELEGDLLVKDDRIKRLHHQLGNTLDDLKMIESHMKHIEVENEALRAKLAAAEQNRDHWARRCFETGLDQVQTAQVLVRIAALEKALVAGFETLLPTLS